MMAKLFFVVLLFLTGCSPAFVVSTPRSITMSNVASWNLGNAQMMAEAECLKYDRHAVHRPDDQRDGMATYECVE